MHRSFNKMADKIKASSPLSSSPVNSNQIWKGKYNALQKHCQQLEQENEQIVNRIYHVKKLLKQSRRQRRGLMQKLDEYNDDYRNAMPPVYGQLVADINTESFSTPHSAIYSSLGNFDPDSPGQGNITGSTAAKKPKARGSSKAEKERDPNAPKKPSNAFFMFCQQQRTAIDQKESTVGHHELTKTLAKEWNNLVPEEKKVYYVMYEKDKARYEQEMKNYTPDKIEKSNKKESSGKKQKKPAKLRELSAADASVMAAPVCEASDIDTREPLVVSPTLNPLSLQSLTAVPFSLPQIPSPPLPLSEDPTFEDFDSTTDITKIF